MRWSGLGVALVVGACSSESDQPPACDADEELVDGRCVSAGTCPQPGIEQLDGSCASVGVAPDGCAEGFSWSEGACLPVLPSEPCAPGSMAIPGETACRPVMECPSERWGGIEGGTTPQWVDASYVGDDSDGTQARPWTTIGDAVAAAETGSTIGVAAGTYVENVAIDDRVVLWGTCPAQVELVGVTTGNGAPALIITGSAASGAALTGLSVTGPSVAVAMSGTTDVVLDRVWLHDSAQIGLDVEDPLGTTSATLRDSLIESIVGRGALALGSGLTIERSVIRGVTDNGIGPAGVQATTSNYTSSSASLAVSRSVIGGNAGIGVFVVGSTAVVDGSVVRDGVPAGANAGYGISLQTDLDLGRRSDLILSRSAVLANTAAGLNSLGSTALIEGTIIGGTLPSIDPVTGLVSDGGRGVNVQDDEVGQRGTVEIVASTVADTHGLGVFTAGAELLLQGAWIRDSSPAALEGGRGVNLQPSVFDGLPCIATIRASLVSGSHQFGIFVGESQLNLEDSEVRDVAPAGELGFGDAVTAIGVTSALTVLRSRIASSQRAGLSVFSANASLEDSQLACHPIDIAVQDVGMGPPNLIDGGGNSCGCDGAFDACKSTPSELTPPSPL